MDKDKILNSGLSLAMEFGKNWLQPIQSRLALHFPYLSSSELDEYNFICKSAMDFSNKLVQSMVEIKGNKLSQKEWEEKVLLS